MATFKEHLHLPVTMIDDSQRMLSELGVTAADCLPLPVIVCQNASCSNTVFEIAIVCRCAHNCSSVRDSTPTRSYLCCVPTTR